MKWRGGKGWTNQIDHPGLSKKKLVYDDMRGREAMLPAAADSAPRAHWSPSPLLPPRPLDASHWRTSAAARHLASAFSRWLLPLSSRRSPQSRLHSDLASRSAVSQGSFHHRSGRGGGGRSRHHPAGEAVSGEERVPTCQLESVGSRCGPPAD